VVEDQAAQELGAAEPAGAVALACQLAAVAPVCGSLAGLAVAQGQELVVQVEVQPAAVAEGQEPAAVVERASVGLVVEAALAERAPAERAVEVALLVEADLEGAGGPGPVGGQELPVGKARRLENGGRRQQCYTQAEAQEQAEQEEAERAFAPPPRAAGWPGR